MRSFVLLALSAGLVACTPAEARGPLNVLMVSIDTMRADRLGRLGRDGRSLTPSLDALAAEGQNYRRAFAQANETLFSHTAVFTGRYPSDLGSLDYESFRLDPSVPTLAGALALRGWRTEGYVAGGHLAPVFGLGSGFDHYQSGEPFSTFQQTLPEALLALERLSETSEPWFLFVHGYDAHTPYVKPGLFGRAETPDYSGPMLELAWQPLTYERIYDRMLYPDYRPPQLTSGDGVPFLDPNTFADLEEYAARDDVRKVQLGPEDLGFITGTYDTAVRQADFFVGVLLDALEATGQSEQTAVIVLSDHGEDLGDHGHYNHRLALYDTNVQVVLITRIPGQAPRVEMTPVGLIDVYATVRELAGLQAVGRGEVLGTRSESAGIFSESMLGQVSIRRAHERLLIPRDQVSGGVPSSPPPGASLLDEAGRPQSWSAERLAPLWADLTLELSP